MKPIVFDKAAVTAVEHRISNANVTSRIKFVALFTAAVAKALEARWLLYDKDQFPKEGYKAIEMDYEIKNFRLKLVVPKLEQYNLEMTSELAHKFKVFKSGSKKKGKANLRLQFMVNHAGSPFELIEYLLRIGGAEGRLEIVPLQQEMFTPEAEKANGKTKKANGKTKPPAAETNTVEWRTQEEIQSGVPLAVDLTKQ